MHQTIAHLVGGTVIVSFWIAIFILVSASVFEFTGISRKIYDKWVPSGESLPLYQTDYYLKPLEQNPYDAFTVQHLNPFYLFSLPWRDLDRKAANNDYVHVDESGFRINPNLPSAAERRAVLLGGSTAFGAHSSSDSRTLAATLTAKTGIGFINRNAPSWNSHQELVALVRYPEPYQLSVSFSFSNDVSQFCDTEQGASVIIGAPESFTRLEHFFNDIRGKPRVGFFDDFSFNPERLFPDTIVLGTRLKTAMIGATKKKRKGIRRGQRCKNQDVTPVVENFLRNQTVMSQVTEARGAFHIVVIQPSYPLHVFASPSGGNGRGPFSKLGKRGSIQRTSLWLPQNRVPKPWLRS